MIAGRFVVATTLLMAPAALLAGPVSFQFELNGAAEAPPNGSPGVGNARIVIDDVAHTLFLDVTFSGLTTGVTAAHIHCCTAVPQAGTAGVATTTPTFAGFPSGVTSGSYTNTLDLTLASSWNAAFVTNNGGTIASAEAVLYNGVLQGRSYLNIHTTQFGGGEIRGFLTPEPGTWVLMSSALIGLAWRRRRRG